MGLAPQNAGNIVKVNNKVTDVEKIFTQSEVEGSPAIKFDISLTKPILIMPRDTNSIEYVHWAFFSLSISVSIFD
jgi:vacuolar protein sorting-associated protein 13A/C